MLLPLKKMLPLWVLLLTLPLACGLGVGIGWYVFNTDEEIAPHSDELRDTTGVFTSPLLECEVFGDQGLKALKPFKYKVEELLNARIADGTLTEASFYFRDLNNGMWFGIDQDRSFRPASLLKLPIMIGYFKQAEINPGILQTKLVYRGDFDITSMQGIEPARVLVPGKSYTVEDLISRMIVFSDNNSAQLLFNFMGQTEFDRVLQDLVVDINPNDQEHYITPHAYSGFFRVLYNASYLNREYSERALELLSRTDFTAGLRAGLPPGVMAATKFGESGIAPDISIMQLHEFGIVYYPGRPYLIGVMTRGKRGGDFAAVIRDLSQLVYESVSQQQQQATHLRPPGMFR